MKKIAEMDKLLGDDSDDEIKLEKENDSSDDGNKETISQINAFLDDSDSDDDSSSQKSKEQAETVQELITPTMLSRPPIGFRRANTQPISVKPVFRKGATQHFHNGVRRSGEVSKTGKSSASFGLKRSNTLMTSKGSMRALEASKLQFVNIISKK